VRHNKNKRKKTILLKNRRFKSIKKFVAGKTGILKFGKMGLLPKKQVLF
jgi:hypothetical protein